MSYFNPAKYSNSSEVDYSSSYFSSSSKNESIDVSNEVVEKGHKNIIKVDIDKFDELCKKFRDKKDIKIKHLTGMDKEEFDLVISYVHLLYGTSYYSHLYDRVKKYFKNVTSIKPGTIGSYFAGCLVTSKEGNSSIIPGCSIGCAGSMPLPKDEEGWNFCDKAVILAEKGQEGYMFSFVKPADKKDDLDPAYVFVESNSLKDFKGFSKSEKDDLKAFGCKKVKLIGYSSDLTYSDLYTEPKSVHEIKHRHIYSNHSISNSNENSSNAALIIAIIILIIFLLIFLIFLCYRYYKMRN